MAEVRHVYCFGSRKLLISPSLTELYMEGVEDERKMVEDREKWSRGEEYGG